MEADQLQLADNVISLETGEASVDNLAQTSDQDPAESVQVQVDPFEFMGIQRNHPSPVTIASEFTIGRGGGRGRTGARGGGSGRGRNGTSSHFVASEIEASYEKEMKRVSKLTRPIFKAGLSSSSTIIKSSVAASTKQSDKAELRDVAVMEMEEEKLVSQKEKPPQRIDVEENEPSKVPKLVTSNPNKLTHWRQLRLEPEIIKRVKKRVEDQIRSESQSDTDSFYSSVSNSQQSVLSTGKRSNENSPSSQQSKRPRVDPTSSSSSLSSTSPSSSASITSGITLKPASSYAIIDTLSDEELFELTPNKPDNRI